MENFSKYTPLAIHEREYYVSLALDPFSLAKRWQLINYTPNGQISLF